MKKNMGISGFTLAEMMIAVAILGIIALIFPQIMKQVTQFSRLHNAKLEIQRDARICLDMINRFLREGSAGSLIIDQVSGQPPYSRLEFSTIDGSAYRFYQSGKKIYSQSRASGSSTWSGAKPISENLRYMAFSYPRTDNADILSISLTMEKATTEGGAKALQLSIQKVRVMN